MVSNDLRMWILGGAVKTASGQKNVGFLPVVVLAQYPLSESEPFAPTPVASVEEDESPVQYQEIIDSELVPQPEIIKIEINEEEYEEAEEEKTEETEGADEETPDLYVPDIEEIAEDEPEEIYAPAPKVLHIPESRIGESERELDSVLLGGTREKASKVDALTDRFRKTQKNSRRRIALSRFFAAAIVLALLVSSAVFAWRFFGGAKEPVAPVVNSEIKPEKTEPTPVVPVVPVTPPTTYVEPKVVVEPFSPPLPIIAPAFGPLLSAQPEQVQTVLPAVVAAVKPAPKPQTKPQVKPQAKPQKPPKTQKTPPPQPQKTAPAVQQAPAKPVTPVAPNPASQNYKSVITESRKNLAQNSRDRESLFALGIALYGTSDFTGARMAFYNCLFIDSPRLPNVTVGNFSLIQNASNRRIRAPQSAMDDIAPLLRATQINPADRSLYINIALSNLKSNFPVTSAELYNTILRHAEKHSK